MPARAESQLRGLKVHAAETKKQTVDSLKAAIKVLKGRKEKINGKTIEAAGGPSYRVIHRNPEALRLFRAESTALQARPQRHRVANGLEDPTSRAKEAAKRDPLMRKTKVQLVVRLREL